MDKAEIAQNVDHRAPYGDRVCSDHEVCRRDVPGRRSDSRGAGQPQRA